MRLLSRPFVTLVCPTYGRPRFVEQTVKLFLRQTWSRSELLIMDDSPAALQTPIRDSARVKVFRLKDRLTTGEKHNLGHVHGQGDVFGYNDDDDWWGPRRIIRQLEPMILEDYTITGFYRDYVLQMGREPDWSLFRIKKGYPARAWVGNAATLGFKLPIHDGTAFYARSCLDHGFEHPAHAIGQKLLFLNELAARGEKCKSIPNQGDFLYVRHQANTWWFRRELCLVPSNRPSWFPQADLEFYKSTEVA